MACALGVGQSVSVSDPFKTDFRIRGILFYCRRQISDPNKNAQLDVSGYRWHSNNIN